MSDREDTLKVPMYFGWCVLVVAHWLVVAVVLNLWADFGMETWWDQVRWDQEGFHVRYIIVLAFLLGLLISLWVGLGHQIALAALAKCPVWWSVFWTLLFCAPLVLATQSIAAELARIEAVERPAHLYSKGGGPTRDDMSYHAGWATPRLENIGPAVLLVSLGLLFFLMVRVNLQRSLANLLRVITVLAVGLAVGRSWYHWPWINVGDIAAATTIFCGAGLPLILAYAWQWKGWNAWLCCGFWAILLVICSGLLAVGVGGKNAYYFLPAAVGAGFSTIQMTLGFFRGFDRIPRLFAKKGTVSERPALHKVSLPFAVAGFLTVAIVSQMAWWTFADRLNPTVLLLAEKQRWKLASFVADLKRFHRLNLGSDERIIYDGWSGAVLLSKGKLEFALATRALVTHRHWENFQKRLNEFGADVYWVHSYPVFDRRYFNSRHWCKHIDGEAIPSRYWSEIVDPTRWTEWNVYGGQFGSEDLRRVPPQLRELSLVNPRFAPDFNTSVVRRFQFFTVWVDEIEQLLSKPRLVLELVYDETRLFVRDQSPEEVHAALQAADPAVAKWLKVSKYSEGGTHITPVSLSPLVFDHADVPVNLKTRLLSTDSQGRILGFRLGADDLDPKAFENLEGKPHVQPVDWVSIDDWNPRRKSQLQPVVLDLIRYSKLVVGNWSQQTDDLKQLFAEAEATGMVPNRAIQLTNDFGFTGVSEKELQNWPWITTLFLWDQPYQRVRHYRVLQDSNDLKRLVLIASPRSIDELSRLDARCDAIYDRPVNLSELLQDIADPSEEWQRLLQQLPFEVLVVPSTISYDEMVELIWEEPVPSAEVKE